MEHCGYGPWFVVLAQNAKILNQTVLFVHTYPELVVDAKNFQERQPVWFIRTMIGPFSFIVEALEVYHICNKNKQANTRYECSLKLFEKYRQKNSELYLWQREKPKTFKMDPSQIPRNILVCDLT